jgi:hypothetical protein
MESVAKKKNKKSIPKGVTVFKKMIEDKKVIREHLKKGYTFNDLKKKGYRFATV